MLTAFVLIVCESRRISEVAHAIAELPNVAEVYSVTGEFDIIALLRLSDYESLDQSVPSGIAQIEGVIETKTVLAFRRYSRRDLAAGFDIGLS
ncbi:AsnC/Lrp family regulatory protein [Oscillochloris trichoides DG-6]|uniref:AsnC/Lrp family regulatory protein n=1 Tax=Oscillochloris trichoides DG-6 TaxID=765420 RepID=E1II06_9CHLR|nr:Lrp/AsnC ligand binding domain-containing protein [Oscillochloris trichoides]EFO79124.1 AsnC/Lrp family regulatory protein [Oscillochloris trichoides DG-6]